MAKPTTLFSRESPDVHIPGAGSLGLALLLVSLSTLFAAPMVILILTRFVRHDPWPPTGFPAFPRSLWLSTVVILLTSGFAQAALHAVRHNHLRALPRWLGITLALALLFLSLQSYNWYEFHRALRVLPNGGAYTGLFYTLTILHAAHVLGGLIPLALVTHRAVRSRYSANFHPGVRYTTTYLHFLTLVWLTLFVLLDLL